MEESIREFFIVLLAGVSPILFIVGCKLLKNRHTIFSSDDYYTAMSFNKKTSGIVFKKILTKDAIKRILQ